MSANRFLWGTWQPDQPAFLNEGLVIADGCYPIQNGYAPVGSFAPQVNGTLASRCCGVGGYVHGASYLFAATASAVYLYGLTGYTSLISGLTASIRYRFCPYSSLMLVTNGTDPIKKFDPASPTAMTNLGGSPPIARYMGVVGGFTVLGYVSNIPQRVAWSDQGNPENWTAGGASEAGVVDLASGGDVTGIVGGEYGLIFQESRITRMDYTAADTVWQFSEIATDIGCVIPNTIATFGKLTFFRSTRGFMVCDGSTVTPIGAEKVDRWFQGKADQTYYDQVSAVIDPANALYIVTVPSADPANTLLIYNFNLQKWSTASVSVELLAPGYTPAQSLDALDATYPILDNIPVSLDSPLFRGGTPFLLVFDNQHRLGGLGGMPINATFTDAKREMLQGRQIRLRSVRPITDAASPTVTVGGANAMSDTLVPTTYSGRRANGTFPTRESWNMVQITVSIPSQPWTFAQGADMEIESGGRA
jgi:hypothetical protein